MKDIQINITLLFLLLTSPLYLFAQNKKGTITGTVTDSLHAVPFANVQVKGLK